MTTDQTDHRAEADRLMREAASDPDDYVGAYEHLLAAIHDGQAEQTALLRALVEQAMPKGDPCPCGCRRDVEPKPRLNGSASHECKRGCGHDEPEVHAIRDASWYIPPLARDGAKPDPLPGLPEAADLLDALRGLGWDVTSRKPKPEPESVTEPQEAPRGH